MTIAEFKKKIVALNYDVELGVVKSMLFGNQDTKADENGIENSELEIFYLIRKSRLENAPYLVFFNGGPGIGFSQQFFEHDGYRDFLVDYNIVFMDQRGTGFSSKPSKGLKEYQYYTSRYIAYDAEQIRKKLLGENKKWIVFGQSFGGHIVRKYLELYTSKALLGISHGYGECSIINMKSNIEKALFRQVKEYLGLYPEDEKIFKDIRRTLKETDVLGDSIRSLSGKAIMDIFAFYFGLYTYEKIHQIVHAFDPDDFRMSFLSEVQYLGCLILNSGILNAVIAYIDLVEGLTDEELYQLTGSKLLEDGIEIDTELFSTVRLSKNVVGNSRELAEFQSVLGLGTFKSDPINFDVLCENLVANHTRLYVIASSNDSVTPIEAINEEQQTVTHFNISDYYRFIYSDGNHREWKSNQNLLLSILEHKI
ncbi:MAG: alpha/beta fold hydrolase [Tissierellales bacterium]|nr:alpha/beta fold hydrolase [Tissierellales bacterium]